jgi:O-antigen/teichoic acid export membrane protein
LEQSLKQQAKRAIASLTDYRDVWRNVTWLSGVSLAVKPFWFAFITVACVRVLGKEGYGMLETALSLTAMTFSVTGFGVGSYTVREVAGDHSRSAQFFTNFAVLRLGLTAVALGAAVLTAYVLGYTPVLFATVLAACGYQAAHSFMQYARKYFRAFEVLKYEAVSVAVEKGLVIAGGSVTLLATQAPHWTLVGMTTGMVAVAGGTVLWVVRHLAPVRRDLLDASFIKHSLWKVAPFGLAGLFGVLFFRIDTVMVQALLGDAAAGQYGLAFRIVAALNMLPLIVARAAAFPRLSSLYEQGEIADFRRLVRFSAWGLTGASLLITVGITLTAPFIIELMTSDPGYGPAKSALRILCWVFALTCVRNMLYVALLSMNEQRFVAGILGGAVLFNVGLNAVLIPTVGILGAVAATIASEATLLGVYAVRYRQRVNAVGG